MPTTKHYKLNKSIKEFGEEMMEEPPHEEDAEDGWDDDEDVEVEEEDWDDDETEGVEWDEYDDAYIEDLHAEAREELRKQRKEKEERIQEMLREDGSPAFQTMAVMCRSSEEEESWLDERPRQQNVEVVRVQKSKTNKELKRAVERQTKIRQAQQVAQDHLSEDPAYYRKLEDEEVADVNLLLRHALEKLGAQDEKEDMRLKHYLKAAERGLISRKKFQEQFRIITTDPDVPLESPPDNWDAQRERIQKQARRAFLYHLRNPIHGAAFAPLIAPKY